jgi:hypothetical protein
VVVVAAEVRYLRARAGPCRQAQDVSGFVKMAVAEMLLGMEDWMAVLAGNALQELMRADRDCRWSAVWQ